MPRKSVEDFSFVVEAIYDCALDPDKWKETLPKIAKLLDSESSTFAVHDMAYGGGQRFFDYGFSEAAVRSYFETYAQINPAIAATPMMEIGIPWTLRMMVPREEYVESRFYKEWSKPNGHGDLMGILALRTGSRIATHAVSRVDSKPDYGDEELSLYKLLAPHICRALMISDALDLKTITSEALEATLDGLGTGVFLVSRDRRVVYMNALAQRQLASGTGFAIIENRFLPNDPAAAGMLNRALSNAADNETAELSGGHFIALPALKGPGMIATVLPLERGRRRSLSQPYAAVAAIFVQDPKTEAPLPGEAFGKLYGLTPSELRVVLAMAPGLQLQETADMMGLSLATIKSHVARVFQKTGTSRQAELVALLLRSSPPAASV